MKNSTTTRLTVLLALLLALFLLQMFLFQYQPYPLLKSLVMLLNSIVITLFGKAIKNNLQEN